MSRWTRWRRYRRQELLAGGVGVLAHDVAKHEAAARQRVSRAIGFRNAENAELVLIDLGEGPKLALIGSLQGLSEDQLNRLPKEAKVSLIL